MIKYFSTLILKEDIKTDRGKSENTIKSMAVLTLIYHSSYKYTRLIINQVDDNEINNSKAYILKEEMYYYSDVE